MMEVALFPIPNSVAFPGDQVPLHVFEPRYRKLIHESVEAQRFVGVCHTSKTIREAPAGQTVEDALRSNQATYQPQPVFSAGPCEIVERLPDGRIIAEVIMQQRVTLVEEVQSLPYRVVRCDVLEDVPEPDLADQADALREQIHETLTAFFSRNDPALAGELEASQWADMSSAEFSFNLFRVLRFDPDNMQRILASTSVLQRLEMIGSVLAVSGIR